MSVEPIPRLTIEYRPVSTLIVDSRNPRRHPYPQVVELAGAIRRFGSNVPVGIDKAGHVITGTAAVLAARLLDMAEVPTIVLGHLDDHERRAYGIAHNRLGEESGWNDTLLALALSDLAEQGDDLMTLGFDAEEVADLLGDLCDLLEGDDLDEDDEYGSAESAAFLGVPHPEDDQDDYDRHH